MNARGVGSLVALVMFLAACDAENRKAASGFPQWDDGRQPGPVVLVQSHGADWATPLDSFPNTRVCTEKIAQLNKAADQRGWPRPDGYECRTKPAR